MGQTILFNNLSYAKLLRKGGVPHADIHAAALTQALSENLYSQAEVDKMVEHVLKRMDDKTIELREEMTKEFHQVHMEIKDLRLEMRDIQDVMLRRIYTALAIATGILVLTSNLGRFFN